MASILLKMRMILQSKHWPSRQGWVALVALFLVIGLAPALRAGGDPPLKKIRFQLDWYPDAERGGFICAMVKGYYRAAGLDVQILPASSRTSPLGSLLTGQIDFSMNQGDQVMIARGQGLPLVCVMATMQHDPQAVMVHDESPVRDFAGLDGHTIAVATGASWFQYVTKKYHLSHVRELPLNFGLGNFLVDPNYIQQVFVTSEPFVCQQQNVKVRTLLIKDTGCDPYRVVVASDQLVARDPAAVQAFVSASVRGWKTYLTDPTATDAEIRRENPEMTQALLDFARKTLINGHFVLGEPSKGEAMGRLDPARFAAQYKILRDLGIIPQDFDYAKSFTGQFVPAK